jgi:hypothetical protein
MEKPFGFFIVALPALMRVFADVSQHPLSLST